MPDTDEPLADRWSKRLRNNPLVAGAIVAGGVLLAVVTFLTQIQAGLEKLKPPPKAPPAAAAVAGPAAAPPAASAPAETAIVAAADTASPPTPVRAASEPPRETRLCVRRVSLPGGSAGPRTVQDCGLAPGEAYAVVRGNVQTAIADLEAVLDQKDFSLFPAMNAYESQQSPEAWQAVRAEAASLETVVVTALEEVKALARTRPDLRPALTHVANSLSARRAAALSFQNRATPPTREEYQRLRAVFIEEAQRLRNELRELQAKLPPVA